MKKLLQKNDRNLQKTRLKMKAHPEPTETPTKPDSGKINLILMLILATIMQLAPQSHQQTQIASETIKK